MEHYSMRKHPLRIPMHPAMHSNMKSAGDSDLKPATPACFYRSFWMMFPKLAKVSLVLFRVAST